MSYQVLHYACALIHHTFVVDPILKSHFPDEYSSTYAEISGNLSGILISRHEIIEHPRPLPPNCVYILGSHLGREEPGRHSNIRHSYKPGCLAQDFADLDLGSSLGWWAATVATYCPSRMVEHPKSKSTQPRYSTRDMSKD